MLAYQAVNMPRQEVGQQAACLPSILDAQVNLAVWKRQLPAPVQGFTSAVLSTGSHISQSLTLELNDGASPPLTGLLPGCVAVPGYDEFLADVAMLLEMFGCLFEVRRAGLRLRSLDAAMCPRWHVDQVPVRLITTYVGPGSEWLDEGQMPRNALGSPRSDGWAQQQPAGRLAAGDIALFKGERWQGNEGRGIIHRSPVPAAGERRLVMTLDWLR